MKSLSLAIAPPLLGAVCENGIRLGASGQNSFLLGLMPFWHRIGQAGSRAAHACDVLHALSQTDADIGSMVSNN